MLTAIVLTILTYQQDPITVVTDERAKAQIVELLAKLPLADDRESILEAAEGSTILEEQGQWVIVHDLFRVWYHREERAVRAVSFSWPEEPSTTNEASVEKALEVALECAKAVLPQYIDWENRLVSATDFGFHFSVTPKIGEVFTMETVTVMLRRRDALPQSVSRRGRTPDYSKYIGEAVISPERALQIGLDAYNRHDPFNAARLDRVRRVLGYPIYGEDSPREILAADQAQIDQLIALPLYWIAFTDARFSESYQHVFVHAIDGRALSVFRVDPLGGRPITSHLPAGSLDVTFGEHGAKATLEPAGRSSEAVEKSLPVVLLTVGKALYSARLDREEGLLWLEGGSKWVAFRPEPGAIEPLAASARRTGTFGKRKDGGQ